MIFFFLRSLCFFSFRVFLQSQIMQKGTISQLLAVLPEHSVLLFPIQIKYKLKSMASNQSFNIIKTILQISFLHQLIILPFISYRLRPQGIRFHFSKRCRISSLPQFNYKQMKRSIIEPLMFASGVSIFLCAHNQNLTLGSYLTPLPFWVLIGRPLGVLWNKKVLSQLNKDVFPAQMKNYRQLYLISRRAIAYDVLFNHCIYHPLFSAVLIAFAYGNRKLQDDLRGETRPNKPLINILKQNGLKLIQFRALTSLTSVISQYWISYFSLNKGQKRVTLSNTAKRFLLLKEFFLSLGWYSYLLKRVNQSYVT